LLWKVSLGWTLKHSAFAVGLNYNYSKEILKKYNELGEEGVKNLKNKQRKQSGGKKPLFIKKVWAKVGKRPMAVVQHRYEWLYIYGFVKLKTGETLWYLIPRVNPLWLNLVYQQFAIDAGISEKKSFVSRR
jgi:hypothetical protein